MTTDCSRRDFLIGSAAVAGAAGAIVNAPLANADAPPASSKTPFGYCFNTSTIREQKLGIVAEIDIISKAGYQGIEPWMAQIQQYQQAGGSLADLKKRFADSGLSIESAIGFAEWIVDDDAQRAKGFETAKRDMDILVQIGGKRLAAPPAGAKAVSVELPRAAERYRQLLELGDQMGVLPQLEVWGHSLAIDRLGKAAYIAIESGHPKACLLPDIYHIYKGGSDFAGLGMLNGAAIHVFHVNDYPGQPDRSTINDSFRVYPGDGVGPVVQVLRTLRSIGFDGMLSLELFNKDYWKQDPFLVAKTGLDKIKAVVAQSLTESA